MTNQIKYVLKNHFYIFTSKNNNYSLPCDSRDLHMMACLPTKDKKTQKTKTKFSFSSISLFLCT